MHGTLNGAPFHSYIEPGLEFLSAIARNHYVFVSVEHGATSC
jgi:hypothetical protein